MKGKTPKKERTANDPLPKTGWGRNGFHKRHGLTKQDIAELARPDNVRAAISIKVPLDVLEFFKAEAEKSGKPYQTQINDVLRAYVVDARRANADPVSALREATRLIASATGEIEKRNARR